MSITILYIEDNLQNLRLIRRMLSAGDYEVLEATTGLGGLEVIKKHLPDLILMDINLPDVEGTEIVKYIRADPTIAHIPVIALTANAMYGDRERFLEQGCSGYLAKPVSRSELLNTIAHYIAEEPEATNKRGKAAH